MNKNHELGRSFAMRIMNGLGWVEILAPDGWIALEVDSLDWLRKTVDAHRMSKTAKEGFRSLAQGKAMSDEAIEQHVLAGLSAGDLCIDAAHWFSCAFSSFPTVNAARLFVQSVMREPGVPAFLRSLVARNHFTFRPISDEQVVDQIAAMIFQGALRVRTGRFVWNSCLPEPKPMEAPPPPPPAVKPPPSPRADPESPSSFGDSVDFAALAAVMKEAAELGVPFCEECQKLQQQRQ